MLVIIAVLSLTLLWISLTVSQVGNIWNGLLQFMRHVPSKKSSNSVLSRLVAAKALLLYVPLAFEHYAIDSPVSISHSKYLAFFSSWFGLSLLKLPLTWISCRGKIWLPGTQIFLWIWYCNPLPISSRYVVSPCCFLSSRPLLCRDVIVCPPSWIIGSFPGLFTTVCNHWL